MQILNQEYLDSGPRVFKFIMNQQAAAFSSSTVQHLNIPGGELLRYTTGPDCNALAGTFDGNKIEIRNNSQSPRDEAWVTQAWEAILQATSSDRLKLMDVSLQGKLIIQGQPRGEGEGESVTL